MRRIVSHLFLLLLLFPPNFAAAQSDRNRALIRIDKGSLRVTSPLLSGMGITLRGKLIVVDNPTNSLFCRIVMFGEDAGILGPGDEGYAKLHRIPFPIGVPTTAICYFDRTMKQLAGMAGTVLYLSPGEDPVRWSIANVQAPNGAYLDPSRLPFASWKRQHLELVFGVTVVNSSLFVQYANNTMLQLEIATNGRETITLPPGEVLGIFFPHGNRVLATLTFTDDTGIVRGRIHPEWSIPGSGIRGEMRLLGPQDIRFDY